MIGEVAALVEADLQRLMSVAEQVTAAVPPRSGLSPRPSSTVASSRRPMSARWFRQSEQTRATRARDRRLLGPHNLGRLRATRPRQRPGHPTLHCQTTLTP